MNSNLSLNEAIDALNHIPASIDYPTYSNLGRAMAREYGDAAFSAFYDWSCQHGDIKHSEILGQWKSYKNASQVTIGTLIYWGGQYGWKPNLDQTQTKLRPNSKRTFNQTPSELRPKPKRDLTQFNQKLRVYRSASTDYKIDPYLTHKMGLDLPLGIDGIRSNRSGLLIPLKSTEGQIRALQTIKNNGEKRVYGELAGSFFEIGEATSHAWVVEGLATGLSIHAATGEPVIVAINANNIKPVVESLRTARPNLRLTGAMDNDCYTMSFAGENAARESRLRYAMPNFAEFESQIDQIQDLKAKPTDFNDLHKLADLATVKRQLELLRGVEHKQINKRYIEQSDLDFNESLHCIRSPKGTGKTQILKGILGKKTDDEKTLIISHRVILNAQLADELDADFYQDLQTTGKTDLTYLRESKRLVITPHSLLKLGLTKWNRVVIDEAEQVLCELVVNKFFNDKRIKVLDLLSGILNNSKEQFFLDADLSDLTLDFCHKAGLSGELINNNFKAQEGSKMVVCDEREQAHKELFKSVEEGEKVFYCANSKDEINKLEKRLAEIIPENSIYKLVGDDGLNKDEKALRHEIVYSITQGKYEEAQVILTSPAACTGLSIDKIQFDKTISSFSYNVNMVEDCLQHISRARGVKDYFIWLDKRETQKITNKGMIRKELLTKIDDCSELYRICKKTMRLQVSSPELEELYCDVELKRNLSLVSFKKRFIEKAKEEGFNVVHAVQNKLEIEQEKQLAEEAEIARRAALKSEIKNTALLNDEQFEQGSVHGLAYTKTYISRVLGAKGEDLDNITLAEVETGYLKRIKPFYLMRLGKKKAEQIDMFEIDKGTDVTALNFSGVKAQMYLRLFGYAGINQLLEYDGTKWRNGLMKACRQWVINNGQKLVRHGIASQNEVDKARLSPAAFLNLKLKQIDKELVSTREIKLKGKRAKLYGVNDGKLTEIKSHVESKIEYES